MSTPLESPAIHGASPDGSSRPSLRRSSCQAFSCPKGRSREFLNVLRTISDSSSDIFTPVGRSQTFSGIPSSRGAFPSPALTSPSIPEHSTIDEPEPSSPENEHGKTFDIIRTQTKANLAREHFEYPSARSLVLMQIVMSLGYCAYMFTSWSYCAIQRMALFPSCTSIWGVDNELGTWSCIGVSLMFWTFPLFCCIVFLLYMYRDLLHTRLYYEMFSHRVNLDFMNIGFLQSSMIRVMLVWMVVCLLKYPMTSRMTVRGILVTLPFWIPVVSFGAMLYTQWDLETRLMSVAKFIETSVEWANEHMLRSYFLKDYIAEAAHKNVLKALQKTNPAPKLTMGEYISLIAEEAERLYENGEEPDETEAFKRLQNSWFQRTYWVRLIIYSENRFLVDKEAAEFQKWFLFYEIITFAVILFNVALIIITTITHLHQQGILPSSILTDWVNLEYLVIENTTPKVAAAAVTGGYNYARNFARKFSHFGNGKVSSEVLPPYPEKMASSGSGVPTEPTEYPTLKSEVVPPYPENRASSGSGVPTKPTKYRTLKEAVTASMYNWERSQDASEHALKVSSKEKGRGSKPKKNLVHETLNGFRPKMSQS